MENSITSIYWPCLRRKHQWNWSNREKHFKKTLPNGLVSTNETIIFKNPTTLFSFRNMFRCLISRFNKGYESTASTLVTVGCQLEDLAEMISYFDYFWIRQKCLCMIVRIESLTVIICKFPLKRNNSFFFHCCFVEGSLVLTRMSLRDFPFL